jgi:indole-3-glycerol phosphate synthase
MKSNLNFYEALKKIDNTLFNPVIPDIKCFSPKDGDLIKKRNPVDIAKALVFAGAPVLSVVTEGAEFHGSLKMLKDICQAVSVPVLRKDFVQNDKDLEETIDAGASAILLMYSCLGKEKLEYFYYKALDMGLTPFVETHTKEDLEHAKQLKAKLIGINNRDILKLERDDGDYNLSKTLLKYAPKDALLISESYIKNPHEVREVIKSGSYGALVGTSLLLATDIEKAYKSMTSKTGIKICGNMNTESVSLCLNNYVDLIGFVVDYPIPVPWNLTCDKAQILIEKTRNLFDTHLSRISIVTGGSKDKILKIANLLHPDVIQLHYTETYEESSEIARELKNMGISCVRSIPMKVSERIKTFGTEKLIEIAKRIDTSPIDCILFDNRDASNASSNSEAISHSSYMDDICTSINAVQKTTLIGGGINLDNISKIINELHPDYVDIMTGVEVSPGIKDGKSLESLISYLRP